MATKRYWFCKKPGCPRSKLPAPQLYAALQRYVKNNLPVCTCGAKMSLFVEFPFKLGARDRKGHVLAVYQPEKLESWRKGRVQFFPFLVVWRRLNRKEAVWLPYWHLVGRRGKEKKKYGQWAPIMDIKLFRSLVRQAKRDGYLK